MLTNGFRRHGIEHLSASSLNLWATEPALWAMERLMDTAARPRRRWRAARPSNMAYMPGCSTWRGRSSNACRKRSGRSIAKWPSLPMIDATPNGRRSPAMSRAGSRSCASTAFPPPTGR